MLKWLFFIICCSHHYFCFTLSCPMATWWPANTQDFNRVLSISKFLRVLFFTLMKFPSHSLLSAPPPSPPLLFLLPVFPLYLQRMTGLQAGRHSNSKQVTAGHRAGEERRRWRKKRRRRWKRERTVSVLCVNIVKSCQFYLWRSVQTWGGWFKYLCWTFTVQDKVIHTWCFHCVAQQHCLP